MATTKAQQRAVNKYVKANYDLYQIKMPKGKKDLIKGHASAQGESVNGFIGRAIDETMDRDLFGGTPEAVAAHVEGGGVQLSPDTLKAAREAAEAAGEVVPQFIGRAVTTQAERDKLGRKMKG